MIEGIFEVGMLLCFAAAWPLSILRSYRARTARGTSLGFMAILEVGYISGILNKYVNDNMNYVVAFYVFNFILVAINISIYFRNTKLDKAKDMASKE